MARKELSHYPPDLWIRELNREHPTLWTDLRKEVGAPETILKPSGLALIGKIPDWCIMPTLFPFLTLTSKYGEAYYVGHINEIMTIATMYTWRASKGIYRFAPEVYDALISQPLSGDIPIEALHHLPEWAVYIESPGLTFEREELNGFIAHLDHNLVTKEKELQLALFGKEYVQPRMIALPLGGKTLADAMDRIDATDKVFNPFIKDKPRYVGSREEYYHSFSCILQLLLYLCSNEPDMPEIEHPSKRRCISGSIRGPKEPRVWDVGVRIASVIRKYRQRHDDNDMERRIVANGGHVSPRPHVRSAHWHTYWVGPRNAEFPERKPVIKWIPPIPVGIDWKKDLPTSIHTVA